MGGRWADAEEVGDDNGRHVCDGLHQRGVACSSYGEPVLLHLVRQTGGVAREAGHGARQEKVLAALRGQWVVELSDLLFEQAGVLPPRQENLARLETWLAAKLAQLPPHHVTLVRPFAEWGIVKDAA